MFKSAYSAAKSALRNKAVQVGTAVTVAAGNAMATVPSDASTAISDGKADASTIAWSVFGILVLIAIARHVRKSL